MKEAGEVVVLVLVLGQPLKKGLMVESLGRKTCMPGEFKGGIDVVKVLEEAYLGNIGPKDPAFKSLGPTEVHGTIAAFKLRVPDIHLGGGGLTVVFTSDITTSDQGSERNVGLAVDEFGPLVDVGLVGGAVEGVTRDVDMHTTASTIPTLGELGENGKGLGESLAVEA